MTSFHILKTFNLHVPKPKHIFCIWAMALLITLLLPVVQQGRETKDTESLLGQTGNHRRFEQNVNV